MFVLVHVFVMFQLTEEDWAFLSVTKKRAYSQICHKDSAAISSFSVSTCPHLALTLLEFLRMVKEQNEAIFTAMSTRGKFGTSAEV